MINFIKRRIRVWRWRALVRWNTASDDVRPCLIVGGRVGFYIGPESEHFICGDCGAIAGVAEEGNWANWLARHDCEW